MRYVYLHIKNGFFVALSLSSSTVPLCGYGAKSWVFSTFPWKSQTALAQTHGFFTGSAQERENPLEAPEYFVNTSRSEVEREDGRDLTYPALLRIDPRPDNNERHDKPQMSL